MLPLLIELAAQAGVPVLRKILEGRIGSGKADLITDVIEQIARRAGARGGQLEDLARDQPDVVMAAMEEVERMTPELVALHAAGLEYQAAQFEAERLEPLWVRAWRPAGMYFIGLLWLWNVIVLHVANAFWKIALPPMDLSVLLQLSGLYMGLYMGGHTLKDVAGKWRGGHGVR